MSHQVAWSGNRDSLLFRCLVVCSCFFFCFFCCFFSYCFLLFVTFVLCLFLSCFCVLCLFLCCFCVFFWSVLICSFCFIMLVNVVVFLCLDFVIVCYLSTPHVGVWNCKGRVGYAPLQGGCVANIHSPINSQCRARHRSTKPSRAMANRELSGQTPPQTDEPNNKLRYQWQGCIVNTLVQLDTLGAWHETVVRQGCLVRYPNG